MYYVTHNDYNRLASNFLLLNPAKMEFIWLGSTHRLQSSDVLVA